MTNLTSIKQALSERNLEILVSDLTPYKDRPIGSLRIDMSDVRSILNLHRESNQLVAYHEQLEAENAALRAERDRLREALKPFADVARYFGHLGDDYGSVMVNIYLGSLRRARALLNGERKG